MGSGLGLRDAQRELGARIFTLTRTPGVDLLDDPETRRLLEKVERLDAELRNVRSELVESAEPAGV